MTYTSTGSYSREAGVNDEINASIERIEASFRGEEVEEDEVITPCFILTGMSKLALIIIILI